MKNKKSNFYSQVKEATMAKMEARKNQSEAGTDIAADEHESASQEEGFSKKSRKGTQRNIAEPGKEREEKVAQMAPSTTTAKKSSDLYSVFKKLSPAELEEKRNDAMLPLNFTTNLVMDTSLYPEEEWIEFPKRPSWSHSSTKQEIEQKEESYFRKWNESLLKKYNPAQLSYYEQNLEVWRQLWRTVEGSDVLLVVCDARNPIFHFPPTLYNYIVHECRKKLVLVLNKSDLVSSSSTIQEWIRYLENVYPGLVVLPFSCNPVFVSTQKEKKKLNFSLRRFYRVQGALEIIEACRAFDLENQVPVDWQGYLESLKEDIKKREQTAREAYQRSLEGRRGDRQDKSSRGRRRRQIEAEDDSDDSTDLDENQDTSLDLEESQQDDDEKQFITIGLIGHPNVGKSSLINALKGKKHVSVSKSPGHTKHFQHIQLAPHLRLCDCPGLVFPSLVPKHLQILSGIYSIAQVQEPLSCIRFVAERVDLIKQLKLVHPESDEDNQQDLVWSPWTICEAYANQKGFLNAKSGRPDVHRAANLILRMVSDGRIVLSFVPPKSNI